MFGWFGLLVRFIYKLLDWNTDSQVQLCEWKPQNPVKDEWRTNKIQKRTKRTNKKYKPGTKQTHTTPFPTIEYYIIWLNSIKIVLYVGNTCDPGCGLEGVCLFVRLLVCFVQIRKVKKNMGRREGGVITMSFFIFTFQTHFKPKSPDIRRLLTGSIASPKLSCMLRCDFHCFVKVGKSRKRFCRISLI